MSTVTLNAPPGQVRLNLLRYGVVASVMSHCVLKSSIEPNDCILKVNGVDLTKKGASEIMNVWCAMENKSKTLTVRKAKGITDDIVDLTTGTTPQSSKRKALGEISNQANDDKHSINNNHKVSKVHAVDSPKSKPTSINITAGEASKEDIDPKEVFKAVWLGKFPKLGSVWPARKLTQEEANNQIQALNPMILTTATNLKQQ